MKNANMLLKDVKNTLTPVLARQYAAGSWNLKNKDMIGFEEKREVLKRFSIECQNYNLQLLRFCTVNYWLKTFSPLSQPI